MKMKNLILIVLLCFISIAGMAQTEQNVTIKADTLIVWDAETISQTDFVYFDNLFNNPAGSADEWQLDAWVCSNETALVDKPVLKTYYQYKTNTKGERYRRTMVINYIPRTVIENKITYN